LHTVRESGGVATFPFREKNMNLSAPTVVVFLISVVLAVLGLLVQYAGVSLVLSAYHWTLLAFLVLAAGNLLKGL